MGDTKPSRFLLLIIIMEILKKKERNYQESRKFHIILILVLLFQTNKIECDCLRSDRLDLSKLPKKNLFVAIFRLRTEKRCGDKSLNSPRSKMFFTEFY